MPNVHLSQIKTEQQWLNHKLNKFGINDANKPLRLEKGQIKVGPKYIWKSKFLKVVRIILSPIIPLTRFIDKRIEALNKVNETQFKDAVFCLDHISDFGKKDLKTRTTITLIEAQTYLNQTKKKSLVNNERVLSDYLNPQAYTCTKKTKYLGVLDKHQLLCNIERDYRIETNPEKIQSKLKKEKEVVSSKTVNSYSFKKKKLIPRKFDKNLIENEYHTQNPNQGKVITFPVSPERDSYEYQESTIIYYSTSKQNNSGIAHTKALSHQKMEDAHLTTELAFKNTEGQQKIKIIGLFNGHKGDAASKYVSDKISGALRRRLAQFNSNELTDVGIWNAIKIAFVDVNHLYGVKAYRSGTTANIVISMTNGDLWVANCGDSRAVLIDPNGQAQQMSENTDLSILKYHNQVTSRGGVVQSQEDGSIRANHDLYEEEKGYPHRVNNGVRVSRSLGDHAYLGAITSRPKITKFEKPENGWQGYHLLQASDGLWDVFSSQSASTIVHDHLKKGDTLATAASKLIYSSREAGTIDNVSTIITELG